MKKLFVRVMAVACVAMALSSCSSSEGEDLLKQIPANSLMVAVVNSEAIAESADVELTDKGIGHLPDYIADELPAKAFRGIDKVNDTLEKYGVKTASVAFFMYDVESEPVAVYMIKDVDRFVDAIADDGYYRDMERDGITVYTRENSYSYGTWVYCIAVKDKYVYQMTDGNYLYGDNKHSDETQRDLIRAIKAVDDEGSFAGTPSGKYIAAGNVGGFAVTFTREVGRNVDSGLSYSMVNDLIGASLNVRASIDGNEIKVTGQLLDKDGKNLNLPKNLLGIDFNGKINGKAVKYLAPSTIAAAAVSYADVDWKAVSAKLQDMGMPSADANQMSLLVSYLNNIGTVTVGIGVKDGLKSFFRMENNNSNMVDDFDFTVVVETTSGDARKLLGQLTSWLHSEGIPFNNERNGISVNFGTNRMPVMGYVMAFDDMLVASTVRISGPQDNKVASAIDFDRFNAAGAVVLDRDSKIMRQLGINCSAQLAYTGNVPEGCYELTFKVSDTEHNTVIKSIISAVLEAMKNADKIQQLYNETIPSYSYGYDDYDYDYDYVWEDEAPEEEVVAYADSTAYYY